MGVVKYLSSFAVLWDKLNLNRNGGIYAWDKDPWVWVYSFRRTEGAGTND